MNNSVSLSKVNGLISRFIQDNKTFIELGPKFKTRLPLYVARDLTLYRMGKSFYEPTTKNSRQLHKNAIADWVAGEDRLWNFSYNPSPEVRWTHQRASAVLHKWLFPYMNNLVDPFGDFDITPGESYCTKHGMTNVSDKLKDIDNWTVTWQAAKEATQLVWHTFALRQMAYEHLSVLCCDLLPMDRNHADSFELFAELVNNYLFTFVNGARLESVPKDASKNRTINVEPFLNMLLQRALGIKLRKILAAKGNDIMLGQDQHKALISNPLLATIDFSNASDGHILSMFEMMFPKRFVDFVLTIRSPMAHLPDGTDVFMAKLSSMGCGFTFEVMTLLLLAVGRCLDDQCRVYGDDVIIKNSAASSFVDACTSLGWQINETKSFIDSPFRESCGSFFHDELGYIDSYKFTWCENIVDVVITANKLRRIMKNDANLFYLWRDIVDLCPASLKGPAGLFTDLHSFWIEVDNTAATHRRNKEHSKFFTQNKWRKKIGRVIQDPILYIIRSFRVESMIVKNFRSIKHELTTAEYLAVLYGQATTVKRNNNRVKRVTLYVTASGNVLSSKDVRS